MMNVFILATGCSISRYVIETRRDAMVTSTTLLNRSLMQKGKLQLERKDMQEIDEKISYLEKLIGSLNTSVAKSEDMHTGFKEKIAAKIENTDELSYFDFAMGYATKIFVTLKCGKYFIEGAVAGALAAAGIQGVMKLASLIDLTAAKFLQVSLAAGLLFGTIYTSLFFISGRVGRFIDSFGENLKSDTQEVRNHYTRRNYQG